MGGDMYNAETAATMLGLSKDSMRQYARRYGIGEKIGRDWVFCDEDPAVIQSRRRSPLSIVDMTCWNIVDSVLAAGIILGEEVEFAANSHFRWTDQIQLALGISLLNHLEIVPRAKYVCFVLKNTDHWRTERMAQIFCITSEDVVEYVEQVREIFSSINSDATIQTRFMRINSADDILSHG